jgi:hypothetical protein
MDGGALSKGKVEREGAGEAVHGRSMVWRAGRVQRSMGDKEQSAGTTGLRLQEMSEARGTVAGCGQPKYRV